MNKCKIKQEMIRNFKKEDGTIDVVAIVKLASRESADFYSALLEGGRCLPCLRIMHQDLMLLLRAEYYQALHEVLQKIYESVCKGQELEGMYFALEDPEFSERYFKAFMASFDFMIFAAEAMVIVHGGDLNDDECK